MPERTPKSMTGVPITDELADKLAEEAERGYDLSRGRHNERRTGSASSRRSSVRAMELAAMDPSREPPGSQPSPLRPADASAEPPAAPQQSGSGSGPGDAAKIVDALKASADTEFQIAERLASKARQAYALAAGVFVVSQTVAFGSFQASKLSSHEQHILIGLAIGAIVMLALATWRVLAADDVQSSGDLPLDALMEDLNAAYDGDEDVLGRLGGYYAGVVRTRRAANTVRRTAYKSSRIFVALSLAATVAELVFALIVRTT